MKLPLNIKHTLSRVHKLREFIMTGQEGHDIMHPQFRLLSVSSHY